MGRSQGVKRTAKKTQASAVVAWPARRSTRPSITRLSPSPTSRRNAGVMGSAGTSGFKGSRKSTPYAARHGSADGAKNGL